MAGRAHGDTSREVQGVGDPLDVTLLGDAAGDQMALIRLPGGAVLYMPDRMRRRLPAGAQRVASRVQGAAHRREQLLAQIDRDVQELRELGTSWNVIGWLTNMSGAGAKKRWAGGDDQDAA